MKNQEDIHAMNNTFQDFSRVNLSSIFENTTDSVWTIDSEYHVIYANKVCSENFHRNFGITIQTGTNLYSALPEPIREVWKSRYDRALRNESFSFVNHMKAGGTSMYLEVFMNPIVIDGQVKGALSFGKDITQRKQDEKALIESQVLLKSSLECQKDTIIFSINKDYEYLYFNSAHVDVMRYAYDKHVQVGMNVLECMTNEDDRVAAKKNFDRALSGESHSNIRMFGDEHLAYYESFFNPIKNDKNEIIGATAMARDISKRKKAELALVESEQKLKTLNSTKDKLFSIIGHDLRGPFNSILGFSDLLIEKAKDSSFTEYEKYLNFIHNSANNTLILLDNLLNWAKSEIKMLNVNFGRVLLSDLIHDVIKLIKPFAKAKNISLNYYTVDNIEIHADEDLLKTVFRNLISNAIKFTGPHGEIRIYAIQVKNRVEITISDNGVGISQERLKTLFKLSADSSTQGTAQERGSGLGLLICKDFIERHNGRLWVESTEGEGSNFKFSIPS